MRERVDQISVKGLISKKRAARKKAAAKCAPAKAKPRKKKKAKSSSLDAQIARKKARAKRKAAAKCAPAKKKRPVAKKPPKPQVRVPAAPVVFPTTPAPPPTAETPATQPPPVDPPVVPPGQPTPEVPPPPPPPDTRPTSPIAMYTGPFGHAQATRLLYRAAFGPRPGEADELAAMGLRDAVASLTRPKGEAVLEGPAPTDKDGKPYEIDPVNVYEMDALYWFDRMMRSSHQLVERMALVLHDWFATNQNGIPQLFMLNQTNLFRKHCFGSFKDLVHDITADPAMILWLNLNKSVVNLANENYARELMELFTLGAGNGYTEQDIREASRSLTGWTGQGGDPEAGVLGYFVVVPSKHDQGQKTIFGQTGNFGWEDVARLVIENPAHPGFFVKKLWGYFIATPPTDAEVAALAHLYKSSGYQIRPVLEAILLHPAFYTGPPMVKPPVVYIAGMYRARGRFLRGELPTTNARLAGQRLYQPPDVGGWDDSRWLDSNTVIARWQTVYQMMVSYVIKSGDPYPADETPEEALQSALEFWGNPVLRPNTRDVLLDFARTSVPATPASAPRTHRQNALRHLIAVSPDFQAC